MNPIPLNVFQRVVRTWDQTHPYNAAQAMRLDPARAPRPARWADTWPAALRALGLGRVVVSGNAYHYEPDNGSSTVDLRCDSTPFEQLIAQGLNEPFAPGVPFRPFVSCSGSLLDVGVVYQHWVADSVSIRMLLQRWFEEALGLAQAADEPSRPRLASTGYWHHFGPHRIPWGIDAAFRDALRSFSRFRSVRRLHSQGSRDYTKALLTRTAPPGIVPGLKAYARARRVTVNDVFIAAAMEQCARHLPFRMTRTRQDLAMGTIVDLRPLDAQRLRHAFGLFLGFTSIVVRGGDLREFDLLLRRVGDQARHAKANHAAASGIFWLFSSLVSARFLPSQRTYNFYRKHMPLAAGISNVNLNRSWAAEQYPHLIRHYVRVSPTGPMIPVAFTPTTLGDDLHLAMTYRTAILSRDQAAAMVDGFLARLTTLAG